MTMTQPNKDQKLKEKAIKLLTKERSRSWKREEKLETEYEAKRLQSQNEEDEDRKALLTLEMDILRDRIAGESRTETNIDKIIDQCQWALDFEKRKEQYLKEEHLKECGR